jgi:NitT/TauT family transport system substrate-binding protein
MRKIFFIFAILGLTIPAVSQSLYAQAKDGGKDIVRLGTMKFAHYGAIWYMPAIAEKYNLKIEFKELKTPPDVYEAMKAGQIDIGGSSSESAIQARAAGIPLYIVAGFDKGGSRIIGRTDESLKSIADLKGKKVAVVSGGTQQIGLLAELEKAGLKWTGSDKDVEVIYIKGYAAVNEALANKQVDAVCQSEPYGTVAISKGFGKEIKKPYDTPMGEPLRSVTMTEEFYNGNKDVVDRVMKCFVEATETFMKHPEVGEKFVRETVFKGQLTSEEYKAAIDNSPFSFEMNEKYVQETANYMAKFKIGNTDELSKLKAADFVKLDALNKALGKTKK